jgi:hypothetical protein
MGRHDWRITRRAFTIGFHDEDSTENMFTCKRFDTSGAMLRRRIACSRRGHHLWV